MRIVGATVKALPLVDGIPGVDLVAHRAGDAGPRKVDCAGPRARRGQPRGGGWHLPLREGDARRFESRDAENSQHDSQDEGA